MLYLMCMLHISFWSIVLLIHLIWTRVYLLRPSLDPLGCTALAAAAAIRGAATLVDQFMDASHRQGT